MTTKTKTPPKTTTLSPDTMDRLKPVLRKAMRALRRAEKRIADTGLGKDNYVRDVKIGGEATVRCCSLGAINEGVSAVYGVKIPKNFAVSTLSPWSGLHRVPAGSALEARRVRNVCDLLYAAAAKRLYPRAFASVTRNGDNFVIPTFNDRRSRTATQVAAILNEAALMAGDLMHPRWQQHKRMKIAVAAVVDKVRPECENPWTTVEA